ncbi:MAG TPA: zinc ribbon domain-containing protein [Coleofasciculaceae cyanobacterium]
MVYACDLDNGQRLFLDNAGNQTLITLASSSAGQQQQASQSIQTGSWIAPPEVFRMAGSIIVKLRTAQCKHFIQVQGSSVNVLSSAPSLSHAQQIQMQQVNSPTSEPMRIKPMEPMKPMDMGNMQMNLKPMEMKMGNMSMQMGVPTAPPAPPSTRQFCSQCGVAIQPDDRFCSSCGHQLGS